MRVVDPVYGAVEVDEPVLCELLESPPLRRIRGVHQAGATIYIEPALRGLSRYEHCLGVMLLLRRFGASLGEQIDLALRGPEAHAEDPVALQHQQRRGDQLAPTACDPGRGASRPTRGKPRRPISHDQP